MLQKHFKCHTLSPLPCLFLQFIFVFLTPHAPSFSPHLPSAVIFTPRLQNKRRQRACIVEVTGSLLSPLSHSSPVSPCHGLTVCSSPSLSDSSHLGLTPHLSLCCQINLLAGPPQGKILNFGCLLAVMSSSQISKLDFPSV